MSILRVVSVILFSLSLVSCSSSASSGSGVSGGEFGEGFGEGNIPTPNEGYVLKDLNFEI